MVGCIACTGGVYAVGRVALSRRGRWSAAVLACGGGAALSHSAAAALWRILPAADGPVDVTVPTPGGRRRSGLRVHRAPSIDAEEVARHDGIPVTVPARTILDLAASGVSGRALERAADEAERLRLCDEDELAATIARHGGRAGTGVLKRLLREHEVGSTLTRSELEELFLALCRDRGLPAPLVNVKLLGLTVDFLWPGGALVVEVDGRARHDTRRGFQDDRDRDSLLAAQGYRTLRFTWWDVTRRPAVVADRVRRVMENGG